MNKVANDKRGCRFVIALVGVALIILSVYLIAMWNSDLPWLRPYGSYIGAFGGFVAVLSAYDTVWRTRQGALSAVGPIAIALASLGAHLFALHH